MVRNGFGATAFALALVLGLVACGSSVGQGNGGAGGTGGTGSTGSAQGKETAQTYCEGKIAREQKCDPANAGTVEACVADGGTKCLFSGIRPEVRDAIVACLNERECGKFDDPCYYEPGLADPVAGQNEFIAACQAKLVECDGTFGDDWCATTILTPEGYASLTPCFDQACGAIEGCLEAGIDAICPGA